MLDPAQATTPFGVACVGPEGNTMRLEITVTIFLAILLTGDVLAHSKTDVIVLENGSSIKGEIKGLLEGKLSFGTDSMGTVQVDWEDVVAVTSEFDYEVRLQNGERYYGSLDVASDTGAVRVLESDSEESVGILDVVELRPIEERVVDRFDARIGFGYSYDNASKVSTFNLDTEVNYQDARGVTSLDGRTTRTDQEGANVSSNRYSIGRQYWTRRSQVIRWFDGSFEDNDELELDYRYTLGFGLGKAIVDTNRQSLVGTLGVQGAIEKSDLTEKLKSLEGVLGVNYGLWRFDSPELDLSTDLTLYPGITESGRWRGNTNIRFSWELIEDFYWDVTTWASYDNKSQSGSDTDYGISTGIAWEY